MRTATTQHHLTATSTKKQHELFAIGAPTSGLVVPISSISSTLLLLFAMGIWRSANGRRLVPIRTDLNPFALACGLISAVLYASMLVFIPLAWSGYSSASQTVSELSAVDAPTRTLWVPLGIAWALLYGAFGWAVWKSADSSRGLRITGASILVAAVAGIFWPPMHLREVLAAGGATLTDTLHIAWTVANGMLTLLAMGFAAAALGRRFRIYSIATMVILLAAGAVTSMDAPKLQANFPTPWMGVWERVNIVAWLLWVAVLSATLLWRVEHGTRALPLKRATKSNIAQRLRSMRLERTLAPADTLVTP